MWKFKQNALLFKIEENAEFSDQLSSDFCAMREGIRYEREYVVTPPPAQRPR